MTHVDAATKNKTRIQLPVTAMKRVKSVSGGVSFHCGDDVAEKLNGLPLDHVKSVGTTLGLDTGKYDHLNPGQQRMNIGNLIRAHVRKNPDQHATFADAAQGVREAHEAATAEANEAAIATAAEKLAAKAASEKEKAERKEARAKAKEESDAAKEEKRLAAEQKKADKEAAKVLADAEKAQKKADAQAARDQKAADKAAAKAADKAPAQEKLDV